MFQMWYTTDHHDKRTVQHVPDINEDVQMGVEDAHMRQDAIVQHCLCRKMERSADGWEGMSRKAVFERLGALLALNCACNVNFVHFCAQLVFNASSHMALCAHPRAQLCAHCALFPMIFYAQLHSTPHTALPGDP